jgi:hypothetical protein
MADSTAEPGLVASSRKAGEDILVGFCGLATSVVTALILWGVEARFGIAFYTWTFWLVIPAGALLSGFAGASGYYAGAWFFGHRPTRLLLLNIVLASVATFFLIHYLSYITLEIQGKQISDYIPFSQYLDIAIRSTSMEFRFKTSKLGSTGELGSFGYVVAVLQVIGFAIGGFAVYAYLVSKPYCDKCSRYLSAKGKQIRYAGDAEGLQAATVSFLTRVGNGDIPSAILEHGNSAGFGTPTPPKDCQLRSVVEIRHCKQCAMHWVKFTVEKLRGDDWKEISELTVERFTDQAVSVQRSRALSARL